MALAAILCSCSTPYYKMWEVLGKEKRDLLRKFVVEAREDQQEASEQFKDALTQIKELYGFEGGNLEKTYNTLKSEYDQSKSKADAVKSRIKQVEKVAADLFSEWERELKTISSPELRRTDEARLRETKRRYESLHTAMKRAERSMEPVLTQFNDQVLFLKHNLNARAIGSLKDEAVDIEREIDKLLKEMSRSISEADEFIKAMPKD